MTESDLKPCPFCGGDVTIRNNKTTEQSWVSCPTCKFDGFMPFVGVSLAISTWNARAYEERIKELEEALGAIKGICLMEGTDSTFPIQHIFDICANEGVK